MLKPILSPILTSIIRGVMQTASPFYPLGDFPLYNDVYYPEPIGGSDALMRYQTNLDGQDDFWLRSEEWAATNPVVEVSFIGMGAAATGYLFDNDGVSGRGRVFFGAGTGFINSTGISTELNGQSIATNTVVAVEGEINHIKITYAGAVGVDRFGADRALGSFYPAAITSIKLTDPASTANSYTYKLNGNAPYELPIGESLGVELVENGGFVGASGWLYQAAGDLVIGKSYEVAFNVVNSDEASQSRLMDVNGTLVVSIGAAGSYKAVFTLAAGDNVLFRADGGVYEVDNVSIKELPASHLTFENGEPDGSDRELITRKADNSGWVGGDKVSNGGFNTVDTWVVEGGWVVAGDGKASISTGNSSIIYQSLGRTTKYIITVEVVIRVGLLEFYDGSSYSHTISTTGVHTFTVDNADAAYQFFTMRAVGTPDLDVLNVTLAPLYDYATGATP